MSTWKNPFETKFEKYIFQDLYSENHLFRDI